MLICKFGGKGWYIKMAIMSLLSCKDSYGYELIDKIKEIGVNLDKGSTGTLYKILRELERDGYLYSYWEKSDLGPKRRKYSISKKGIDEIREEIKTLKDIKNFIDKMIENCKGVVNDVF